MTSSSETGRAASLFRISYEVRSGESTSAELMPEQAGLKRSLKAREKGFNTRGDAVLPLPPPLLLQLGNGGENARKKPTLK